MQYSLHIIELFQNQQPFLKGYYLALGYALSNYNIKASQNLSSYFFPFFEIFSNKIV